MELSQLPQFSTTALQSLSALLQEERRLFLGATVLALGLLIGWIMWG
jgi:hypothetical protein